MIEIWVDGSVRGNPGIAGTSIYVKRNGVYAYKNARVLPRSMTNNEAEYEAVLDGLKYAQKHNAGRLKCVLTTDSQLVFGQLVQNWKCNFDHLRNKRDEVRNIIAKLPFSVEIKWAARFNNSIANDLAQDITLQEKERKG